MLTWTGLNVATEMATQAEPAGITAPPRPEGVNMKPLSE
jgi:hypothetical protein